MPRIGEDIDVATISPPQRATSYCLWQDGDHWGCVRGDFESFEGSIIGIGATGSEAFENLLEELAREEIDKDSRRAAAREYAATIEHLEDAAFFQAMQDAGFAVEDFCDRKDGAK